MLDVPWQITTVVSGCASGADTLGERWALEHAIPIVKFPAKWTTYGKSAGPIRNREMAKYADALVAFRFPNSQGTQNMIKQATKFNLNAFIVDL